MINIVAISGSLRKGSFNTALLHAAQKLAPDGVVIDQLPIGNLPLMNQDMEMDPPAPVKELKQALEQADGILLVTPEYNYSFSGVLKNAIDWATRPYGKNSFSGKPLAIMSASPGMFGGVRAQTQLRQVFVSLNVYLMTRPEIMVSGAGTKFDDAGILTDQETKEKVTAFLQAFTEWIGKMK